MITKKIEVDKNRVWGFRREECYPELHQLVMLSYSWNLMACLSCDWYQIGVIATILVM